MDWITLTNFIPLLKPTYRYLRSFFPQRPVPMWRQRLNHLFEGDVRIFAVSESEPQIHLEGELSLTRKQAKIASEIASSLSENEKQSVLVQTPDWESNPIQFRVRALKYSAVLALREVQPLPKILSANTLLICRDRAEIIIQRRGPEPYVKSYADCLGVFGGGYDPSDEKDANSLLLTAIREVWEETKVPWAPPSPSFMVAEEISTGYVQIAFLGVNISREARNLIHPRMQEGTPVYVSYDELPNYLKKPTEKAQSVQADFVSGSSRGWVPIGKAHVLAWLAHGAPGAGRRASFGGLSARQLFNSLVPKID